MNQPVYVLAYGLRFATGTYLGMVVEQRLVCGKQLVFFLTPKGPELAEVLCAGDNRVAASRKLPKNDCFFEPSKFRASPQESPLSP